ncbi:MAG: hypothetical protein A2W93_02510 [Bacteroidetes bacterium GWF2_43_63]|nr:MAG: hypothetical protein A2W94_08520 [Bacteroidetes bacterium GWE2_42_42]OFY53542.1 MAG: hypothetical protein A2W93_02510 [Bacteroidetes bacterium GWF2_43_63]HBG71128.1 hypothetical protein [Bacteroidales bacterium]HCB63705.1 hypothetical protein [Bacteroidales bacterium]HCY24454.1 hypothetical protein [Bacteroidales bacterium]
MARLKIKLLAFKGAPDAVFENTDKQIQKLIASENYVLVDDNPDVLFFLSGGSEMPATEVVTPDRFYMLIGSTHNNSYASATEVKAWMNARGIPSLLLDEEESDTRTVLENFLKVRSALENLKEKRAGLIGNVSDWLISSAIDDTVLKEKTGIQLIQIPWEKLKHFSEFEPSETFLNAFDGHNNPDLEDTARVYTMLNETIATNTLDAITVECFPMVKKDGVTACLPLAKFNNDGFPAGCEGDITAITGMMLGKELTGLVPWIANTNKISNEVCVFSHCTIAPCLIDNMEIKTHFETGMGTAVEGDFKNDIITIFRFDHALSKAFVATTKIIGRPKSPTACRTQIEVQLSEREVNLLQENPLGNHHLILPGDWSELIRMACRVMGVQVP